MSILISSKKNYERDALSELFYVLSDVLGYKVRPLKSRIPGLSLLSFREADIDIYEVINKIRHYIKTTGPLVACMKVVPLERLIKSNLSNITENAVSLARLRIDVTNSWRIQVRKRQTNLRTIEVIDSIAEKVDWGRVNLKDPDYEIRVEILRDLAGISVMKPEFELRKLTDAIEEE